jgi:hypothetical protein
MTTTSRQPTQTLSVRLSADLLRDLTTLAQSQDKPLSELHRQALEDIVNRHKQTRPVRPVTLEDMNKKIDALLAVAAKDAVQRRKTDAMLAYLATALGLDGQVC